MKDCGEYQREISLLIDGALAEPQKTGLLRHIGQCDECRRVYDAFNAISLSLPEEAAPAGFAEDVMSAIKGLNVTPMPVPEKKRPFRWKRAAALAACLAVVVAAAAALPRLAPAGAAPEAAEPAVFGMMGEDARNGDAAGTETEPAGAEPADEPAEAAPEGTLFDAEGGTPSNALPEEEGAAAGAESLATEPPRLRECEVTGAEVYESGELLNTLSGEDAPELAALLKYAGPYGGEAPAGGGYCVSLSMEGAPELTVEVYIVGGGLACLCNGEAYTAEGSAGDFLDAVGG